GDHGFRILPRVIAAGMARSLRWSASLGLLVRPQAFLPVGRAGVTAGEAGSELQVQASLGWAGLGGRLNVGPELLLATVLSGAFSRQLTSLEGLVGAHYLARDTVLVGVGIGAGLLGHLDQPGTPDFRALVRVAYAPVKREKPAPAVVDTDGDGVPDPSDACPAVKGIASSDP